MDTGGYSDNRMGFVVEQVVGQSGEVGSRSGDRGWVSDDGREGRGNRGVGQVEVRNGGTIGKGLDDGGHSGGGGGNFRNGSVLFLGFLVGLVGCIIGNRQCGSSQWRRGIGDWGSLKRSGLWWVEWIQDQC